MIIGDELFQSAEILIHTDADDLHAARTHLLGKFFKAGGFFDTGRAPGGPEVDQHHVMVRILESEGRRIHAL